MEGSVESVDARPPHPLPLSFENWPSMPSVLYQGMIEPKSAPLALTGAVWYQGEASSERAYPISETVTGNDCRLAEIVCSRRLSVLYRQPAGVHASSKRALEAAWAEMREARTLTARSVRIQGSRWR